MPHAQLFVDFTSGAVDWRRKHGGGKNQLIAKAIGIKPKVFPTVLDLTGGLGKDAFVLASLGCQVTLLERNPQVHAALEAGIRHARDYARTTEPTLSAILDRISLHFVDSLLYLREHPVITQQVIYLDPMFPERKKTAAVKKDMVLLQEIVGADDDSDKLLLAALNAGACRVVVKRPKLAPSLAAQPPPLVYRGTSSRFDVYPERKITG